MLEWSIAALHALDAVRRIVVALPPDSVTISVPEGVVTVAGGATRSASVLEALLACGDGDPVIVHDAARPLATPDLFERALLELAGSDADAVIAAMPVSDTIKEVGDDGRTVVRTPDRGRLWAVQTPQVLRRAALDRALIEAPADLLASATDDAWLVEQAGGTVRVVPSGPDNLKVTTVIDLRLAEMLLAERA